MVRVRAMGIKPVRIFLAIISVFASLVLFRSVYYSHSRSDSREVRFKVDDAPGERGRVSDRVDSSRAVVVETSDGAEEVVQAATAIFRKKGVVLFAVVNDAYFDLAASWCCNTAAMGDLHERVLFVTTDVTTGQRLKTLWPKLTVVSFNTSGFSGAQEYSKAGYVRITAERTRLVLRLLEAGLRMLLFEVDCLWLSDPLPLLTAREGDIIATKVTSSADTASGFLLLNPTTATVSLWRQLTQSMMALHPRLAKSKDSDVVPEHLDDQPFLTGLVKKKYAGIRIVYMPPETFPDGKWYGLPASARAARPRPVIINNNWVIGKDAKVRRAKAFGHWFWISDSGTCNSTALHSLFH